MKGILSNKANQWFVTQIINDNGVQFGVDYPILPTLQKYYFLDEDAEGSEVEFELEVVDNGDNGIRYASLVKANQTPKIYESPDGGETVYERTAGDYTKKLKPKYTEGKGISFYLSQDQFREMEVEKIANEQYENVGDEKLFPNHTDKDIWVNGFVAAVEYIKSQVEDKGMAEYIIP